jgi:MFS family permease
VTLGRLKRRWSGLRGAASRLAYDLRAFPRQFWILVAGTFVYTGAAALGFPFEGIYMSQTLHISLTVIGVVFGLVTMAVMPFQVLGGTLTDRFGRKSMMLVAAVSATVWRSSSPWRGPSAGRCSRRPPTR